MTPNPTGRPRLYCTPACRRRSYRRRRERRLLATTTLVEAANADLRSVVAWEDIKQAEAAIRATIARGDVVGIRNAATRASLYAMLRPSSLDPPGELERLRRARRTLRRALQEAEAAVANLRAGFASGADIEMLERLWESSPDDP